MNVLVIPPHSMLHSAPVIYEQERAFLDAGVTLQYLSALPLGKRSPSGTRVFPLVEQGIWREVPVHYLRYLSASTLGAKKWNATSAEIAGELLADRVLQDFQPDMILAHTIGLCGQLGTVLKRKSGAPLVITTHGSDTNDPLQCGMHDHLRTICDQADAVVAVSNVLQKNLATCGTSTPISCIFNGVALRNLKELPKIPHRIIQVSNLVPGKHIHLTIQAVAQLRTHYPDISLTVVGDGPEENILKALCRELNVVDVVRFTGRLSNADAMAEMAVSQIFAMPSYPEGFGIAYTEAMASGCVAIGTQGEGIDGVIVSGENGFLVPRDDVASIVEIVDQCFQDESLMRRVADAGKATAMELTWENNAKRYLELFESLIKKDPS